jgi:hypothetical protein
MIYAHNIYALARKKLGSAIRHIEVRKSIGEWVRLDLYTELDQPIHIRDGRVVYDEDRNAIHTTFIADDFEDLARFLNTIKSYDDKHRTVYN